MQLIHRAGLATPAVQYIPMVLNTLRARVRYIRTVELRLSECLLSETLIIRTRL